MSDEPSEVDPRVMVLLLASVVEGGLIVLAWLLGWLLDELPLEHFRWDALDALRGVLATVPLLFLFVLLLRWPIGPLGRIKQFSEQVLRPFLAPCTVLDLFAISGLAGLGEEMLFRGVVQGAFSRWLPPALAVALASILFGALHAITFAYAALAACMGAYLGWLWIYSGNLLVPVVTHALYDFVVLVYFVRGPGSGLTEEQPQETANGGEEKSAPADEPPEGAESRS